MAPKKASTRSLGARGSTGGSSGATESPGGPPVPAGNRGDMPAGWLDAEAAYLKMTPEGSPGPSPVNMEHFGELHQAWQELMGHAVFAGIVQEKPLTLSEGAATSPFSQSEFEEKQNAKPPATNTYEAGGNVFWLNLYWGAAPAVPINRNAAASSAVALGTFARPA